MIVKTASRTYEVNSYGYGATLPTGERLWSCVIEPEQLLSAAECAQDLACGNIEIYSKNLLIETVTGMTKVRQYACTVKDDAIDSIMIILQEPGMRDQLDEIFEAFKIIGGTNE